MIGKPLFSYLAIFFLAYQFSICFFSTDFGADQNLMIRNDPVLDLISLLNY